MATLIIGNKSDLEENRAVNIKEINELIMKYSFQYTEVSAKTGNFIKSAFESLTKLIIIKNEEINRNLKNKKKDNSQNVTLNKSGITLDRSSIIENKRKQTKTTCCGN